MNYKLPVIPESILVHLGPPNSSDRNMRVNFVEYIKNVASGELYPNWPEEALRANILAIISFTLNRIYNEWYRSLGYNFDITSSSQYDQSFSPNRQFFERIYVIVDEIFNHYIVRSGQVQPLFASYCDGKKSTCDGLSQWGSVTLSNQGLNALAILKRYYGNTIQIVEDAPVENIQGSYPGTVVSIGDAGDYIRLLKKQINRIGQNYPAIPVLMNDTVYFDLEMENAVKEFQSVFSLPIMGSINEATWYKIKYYYNAVKNISNLYSEGITKQDVELKYPSILKIGDSGKYIRDLHYYLNVIACFDESIPYVNVKSEEYNTTTFENVSAFQKKYGLRVTGEVDVHTWNQIKNIYQQYIVKIPSRCQYSMNEFFSGRYLSFGMVGEDVLNLQRFLFLICQSTHEIPGVVVSGEFDTLTERSVKELQKKFGLDSTGVVTATTWYDIIEYQKRVS